MATSAQQATFAAQQGKNWADPNDPNFGKSGFIGQNEYNQYQQQTGGSPSSGSGQMMIYQPTSTTPPPITTAQQVTSTTTPVGQTSSPGTSQTVAGSFQQGLVNNLNPQPVSASNPNIAPAIQANQYQEQRGLENQRNALAEDAARSGTDMSGGNNALLAGLMADSAARQGQYAGGLINQQSMLDQMKQGSALNLAGGLLSGQQSLGQQQSLADLQAQLQREALAQQGSLGNRSLDVQQRLGEGQLNEGLLGLLLNNQQFGQQLGLQAGEFGAGLDAQTLMGLLGGLA